jgi:hypothetical protein
MVHIRITFESRFLNPIYFIGNKNDEQNIPSLKIFYLPCTKTGLNTFYSLEGPKGQEHTDSHYL